MIQKILITGGKGMLAHDLNEISSTHGWDVTRLSHQDLDITRPDQTWEYISNLSPDVVINTPGLGVDYCELNPEGGYLLHSWSAGIIARQCQRIGAMCVYISTCGLFGDDIKPYSEYDETTLKTIYARSKFLGEKATLENCDKSFIFRPGWLYGGTPGHQRNFVYQRYLEGANVPLITSASDKYGSPTFTRDVAAKMLEVMESEEYGIYHITNSGQASRYEYVKFIIENIGLDTVVEPVDSTHFQRTAPVPNCEVLENFNIKFLGLTPMEPWQDAIERYIFSMRSNGII